MKSGLFTLALILLFSSSFAQSNETSGSTEGRTSFYAELGGVGILFSANIDTRFKPGRLGWGGRIGLGFVSGYIQSNPDPYTGYENPSSVVTFPLQLNYVFGKGTSPHTFEVGAGLTIAGRKIDIFNFYGQDSSSVFGSASFMYRRQPVNGGFSWRIGFTPLIAKGYIQPTGGVSVGYNF
jgi:hypothetical protein